ncbi:M20 family metallo-hydrolase [Microvirga makkahensis]|uniref:Hydantoinase/carbamoylase family amidase n=1 Tax=Microvirga makkahensis TaxID=1128670 RepID=A0A7X3SN62_9HYPH|nr:M20 family metallo-hydrolase [Microvirga makkahensis]MXQ10729.1 hydantoinase/carbamoylase family amidase [Microvirga makkahensis]
MIPNLQIDARRLWDSLMDTARIGGTPKGGISRLTLTEADRQVRDWLKTECERLGCTVTVDEVGNMFAVRPGRRSDLPPIAIGSHLDTQPTGGKFDGVLGVLGGLEILRTLQDSGYETNAPLMLVNWTNEEGSRFAPAMLGSGVYAGVFDRAYADSREDRQGVTFGEAVEAIGYRGEAKAGSVQFGAMFELHIEQGPILEQEEMSIGIVEGVQGMRWYEISVTGREAHTGSTPMPMRRDALVGAARLIDRVEAIALEHAPSAVGSVGLIEAQPNSRNVVPGRVFFTVDFRHPDDAALDVMEQKLQAAVEETARKTNLAVELKTVWESPAVRFDADCLASVRRSAEAAGYPARPMISGAGHDAAYVARVAPTAMIFVPCAGGLSHNEEESTSFEECAAGAQVLLGAVLDYDGRGTESPR